MATPYLSEICIVAFNFAPQGYEQCNGQLLPINQNQALFYLLGTTYGGDGRVNFGLPDFRGRVPIHMGTSSMGVAHTIGATGGTTSVTMSTANIPEHSHTVVATLTQPTGDAATNTSPANAFPAADPINPRFSNKADEAMAATPVNEMVTDPEKGPLATENNVTSQLPFPNVMPYLVLNFIIATQGIFPTQN